MFEKSASPSMHFFKGTWVLAMKFFLYMFEILVGPSIHFLKCCCLLVVIWKTLGVGEEVFYTHVCVFAE
jgi:hypothetical protein